MLASQLATRRIDLPHEPGAWIEVRHLSARQLQAAREAAQRAGMQMAVDLGGMALLKELAANADQQLQAAGGATVDVLATYDRFELARAGIVAWSYDVPVTPENVEDLDDATLNLVARELIPAERSEADRGEGSSGSTSRSTAKQTRPTSG